MKRIVRKLVFKICAFVTFYILTGSLLFTTNAINEAPYHSEFSIGETLGNLGNRVNKMDLRERSLNHIADEPYEEWNVTYGGCRYDGGKSVKQTKDSGFVISGYTQSYGEGGYDIWLLKTNETGVEQWNITFGGGNNDEGYYVQETTDKGFIISGSTKSFGAGYEDIWVIKTNETGQELWNITFGGCEPDEGHSIIETQDGSYIVIGSTWSQGEDWENDAWLIKISKTGHELWNRTFGGYDMEEGFFVQETQDNGFIFTGSTWTYGVGNYDVWLVKTNETGQELWNQSFGGIKRDIGHSVQLTSDGGFIVIGYTQSYGAGSNDIWLIKTNETGHELWNATFGGCDPDEGYSILETQDGGYIITGKTWSYGAGSYDLWVIKTNETGYELWNKTFGGSHVDEGYEAQVTNNGGYILTGFTRSYSCDYYSDAWLIKIKEPSEPEPEPKPDLYCSGSLSWVRVQPGSNNSGSFIVENIGDSQSLLDWNIIDYPDWGMWVFTPKNGSDLKPEDGSITIDVTIVAPEEKNKEFSGNITIINTENSSDICQIPVSLTTPTNKYPSQPAKILNFRKICQSVADKPKELQFI